MRLIIERLKWWKIESTERRKRIKKLFKKCGLNVFVVLCFPCPLFDEEFTNWRMSGLAGLNQFTCRAL